MTGSPNSTDLTSAEVALGPRFVSEILGPLKNCFVGKDEIIDLLGLCLVARENLFILGPPGTAKSAIVQETARQIDGKVFDYLLTRFTEPNEIFGPFDIRKLREGELITNTEGMLPEADFVFLDELLNANSAILNSLLLVLNERVFRRGRETRRLPTLTVVGASNRLPEDDALGALFDRFLLRVRCDNVAPEELPGVLDAGWRFEARLHGDGDGPPRGLKVDDVRRLQRLLSRAKFSPVRSEFVSLVHRLRHAGVAVSDRRAVKLQRILAASALLCGRLDVNRTDLWVMRYIWDTEEQEDVLAALVRDAVDKAEPAEQEQRHPRSRGADAPDPEHLAEDLERLSRRLDELDRQPNGTERSYVQDQVGLLAGRCQWVGDQQQRDFLQAKLDRLFERLRSTA
jgi:MoxR-like ATPase